MEERIKNLCSLTLEGKAFVFPVKTEYAPKTNEQTDEEYEVSKLCTYILNQQPFITEWQRFTGFFQFDGSCRGDAFRRGGHHNTQKIMAERYLKSTDNLSVMEWQHATADYQKVLSKGIEGIIEEIELSISTHDEKEEIDFLIGLKKTAFVLIRWAEKCSKLVSNFAKTVENLEHRNDLEKLSKTLQRIPKEPPKTFYEAVLCIYICFSADPDSVGMLDRYLYPFYKNDIESAQLTKTEAKSYLQELFLMLQSATNINSPNFTRGGESHFCVGGYLANGEDCFSELSKLIIESLIELPTYIPQLTLRWTNKLSRENFRFVLDAERRDPHKRIAFTNDEKRIKCYTEICGFPIERAVEYTCVGCNEPAFVGAITGSNSKINALYSLERLFFDREDEILNLNTFDEFYALFDSQLKIDITKALKFDDDCNYYRSKDINYISSLFFKDCIENAKSLTQGGGKVVIASPMMIGLVNVIDSLAVVKQFVFEEKLFTMRELINALKNDWKGYEKMRFLIKKKGKFFGNDDDLSNSISERYHRSLSKILSSSRNLFGYRWLLGDLLGYNEHHKWFGAKTKATPDGRGAGEMLKYGFYQSKGMDREGLTATLNSIAKSDPENIRCGSTVTNIYFEETLINKEENFEKVVLLLETYFKMGGVHFQLNYVSKEDLMNAKNHPDEYRNLRVRVTGFADYFVNLKESLQDEIIQRTVQKW